VVNPADVRIDAQACAHRRRATVSSVRPIVKSVHALTSSGVAVRCQNLRCIFAHSVPAVAAVGICANCGAVIVS
jgi:hypothetical protein